MHWKSSNNGFSKIHKDITEIFNNIIRCINFIINKKVYINILVILLSVGLISAYFYSIKDKDYWGNTFKTINKETIDKVILIKTTFVDKKQSKLATTIQLAYNNGRNAINKKTFHKFPEVNIRDKASIIEKVSKKSFNTIDESKRLRLGELKWKLFSKIQ